MSASAVIAAIKSRLEGAGYTVALFRTIDAEYDTLPLVGVYFGEDGASSEMPEGMRRTRTELDLEVVLVSEAVDADNAEMEAVQAAETLAALLVQHKADKAENYGGACHRAELALLTVETRPAETDAIVSRVQIRAHY